MLPVRSAPGKANLPSVTNANTSPPIARAAIAANMAIRSGDFHKRGGKVLASSLRVSAVISVGFEVAACFGSLSFLPALFLRATNCYPLHGEGRIPKSSSLRPVRTLMALSNQRRSSSRRRHTRTHASFER